MHLAATRSTVPHLTAATSTTFTVDTTDDTSPADPSATTCADANGNCSLRA